MSKTIKIKWPSITPGHPRATPGWISHDRRAILAVEDVPDGISLSDVILLINQTFLLVPLDADAPQDQFAFSWSDLRPGSGQILDIRKKSTIAATL